MPNNRPYDELRAGIEERGGSMNYEKEGTPGGAWIVMHEGKTRRFESNGAGFPELDRLYVPKIETPKHYSDYTKQLTTDAIPKLLNMLQ